MINDDSLHDHLGAPLVLATSAAASIALFQESVSRETFVMDAPLSLEVLQANLVEY
jgi:hypothetical protein